jgi:predicted nucleic acid-binding Zn ribbon protein
MHGINAEAPKCERCGRDVRRVFSPVGIIFKGSGWHITDYRKTPAPAEGEAKKTGAEKSSAEGGTSDGKAKTGAAEDGASGKSNGKSGSAATGGAGSKPASRSRGGTTS